jgi:cytochrome c biogenesis protein CcmG, thiol:disulfide interchange protein DsbE
VNRIDSLLVALMAILAVALVWIAAGTLEQPVTKAGDKAPAFTIVTDQGEAVSPSRFRGKLLVLNFWATWCAGCIQEITSLDEFQRAFASQGVVVVGISMDSNEARYKRFLQRFPVSFITNRDPSWGISTSYGTFQLPETFVINRSGKVVEKLIAAFDFMDPEFLGRIQRDLN